MLDFPQSPNAGDTYGGYTWNGVSWTVVGQAPGTGTFLPILGGTVTGNLGVIGDSDLQSDLDVGGVGTLNKLEVTTDSELNTLDVTGAASFGDTVTLDADPTQDLEAATKQYVDQQIIAQALYQGTWEAETNTPDLSAPALRVNGWTWAITLVDPNQSFTVPATPVIPGLSNETVNSGDHVTWSTTAAQFEVIRGASPTQINFRPMTADLHDWIPPGTRGLFVGEGNPLNRPLPNQWMTGPFSVPTKWRFICSSDGDAMTMTAISIATHPSQTEIFQKTKKPGVPWDYRWIRYGNEYNLVFHGRAGRPLNPSSGEDRRPVGFEGGDSSQKRGWRLSHNGLIHAGWGGNPWHLNRFAHPLSKIQEAQQNLRHGFVSANDRKNNPTGCTCYVNFWHSPSSPMARRKLRWVRMQRPGGAAFPFKVCVTIWVSWTAAGIPVFNGGLPDSWSMTRDVVWIDCRTLGSGATWVEPWRTDASAGSADWRQGFFFQFPRSNSIRVHYDEQAGDDLSPSGKVIRLSIERSAIYDLILVNITMFGPSWTQGSMYNTIPS